MSRYETFVIRLWIEDDSSGGHGEVRHLASGKGMLFKKREEVTHFIESIIDRESRSVGAPDGDGFGHDGRMIDFGASRAE